MSGKYDQTALQTAQRVVELTQNQHASKQDPQTSDQASFKAYIADPQNNPELYNEVEKYTAKTNALLPDGQSIQPPPVVIIESDKLENLHAFKHPDGFLYIRYNPNDPEQLKHAPAVLAHEYAHYVEESLGMHNGSDAINRVASKDYGCEMSEDGIAMSTVYAIKGIKREGLNGLKEADPESIIKDYVFNPDDKDCIAQVSDAASAYAEESRKAELRADSLAVYLTDDNGEALKDYFAQKEAMNLPDNMKPYATHPEHSDRVTNIELAQKSLKQLQDLPAHEAKEKLNSMFFKQQDKQNTNTPETQAHEHETDSDNEWGIEAQDSVGSAAISMEGSLNQQQQQSVDSGQTITSPKLTDLSV